MESTQDGVEQIHAAEESARGRIEDAEKRARAMREETEKESRKILQQAEENASREASRLLQGVTKDSSKIDGKMKGDTETHVNALIAAAEKKKRDAVKAALKLLLEE